MKQSRRHLAAATLLVAVACSESTGPGSSGSTKLVGPCSDALTVAAGDVQPAISGTTVCVAGGANAAADYALVPFNGSTTPSATASFTVTANGTRATPISPARIPVWNLEGPSARTRDVAFEARLRRASVLALGRRVPAAREWLRARRAGGRMGASRDAIPSSVTVGQILRLNANGNDPCNAPDYRMGRVVAISQRAIAIADTSNPAGGYTDADYQSIGITFDTLVDPVDRTNFGDPTDIDQNGHVVLFFTSAVNQLTPPHSTSYVGGFFFVRDLFPTTDTPQFGAGSGCPTSNVGEMFYLLVPDPTGTVNQNVFSKQEVTINTIATLAHEYQHLINASRRMYLSNADWEETWLDEGLSHIAEELLFYAVSGLQPAHDIDGPTVRSSSLYTSAFENYQAENFLRYREFLESPSDNSPYAANDSLSTRGATWDFLRYAADRRGGTQSATWMALVNSTTTGIANLQHVFGTDVTSWFRDWATSVLTDDLTGVAASWQQPSWNTRSIFSVVLSTGFPLTTRPLTDAAPETVTLDGGGSAYLLFSVGAGHAASISWSALPGATTMTLVRID